MASYLTIVRLVTDAKEAMRESIAQSRHPQLLELFKTPACERCIRFIESQGGTSNLNEQEAQQRGARLLLILTAIQNPDEFARREQLCLLGARNAAYECLRPERRRMAALERKKPLRDVRYYVDQHLPRTQKCMAGELEALVNHPELLEEVLCFSGSIAMAKHL